jgi:hypothetical protein
LKIIVQAVFCADLRKNEPTMAANPNTTPRIPNTKGTAMVEATGFARMISPKMRERIPRLPTPQPWPVNAPYRAINKEPIQKYRHCRMRIIRLSLL